MPSVVYNAVRAVGTLRPKFNPGPVVGAFSNELNVVGTSFWLREQKILITCAHVIQNLLGAPLELTGLLVVGKSGAYRRAIIDVIDHAHDLAVLRAVGGNGEPLTSQELDAEAATGLSFVPDYPEIATGVSYVGFPLGNRLLDEVHSPTYAEGTVGVKRRQGSTRKDVQISGPVVGGFSGSPVVLKDHPDQLLGVVSNGPAGADQGSNIFMAVSWEHVRAIAQLAKS